MRSAYPVLHKWGDDEPMSDLYEGLRDAISGIYVSRKATSLKADHTDKAAEQSSLCCHLTSQIPHSISEARGPECSGIRACSLPGTSGGVGISVHGDVI